MILPLTLLAGAALTTLAHLAALALPPYAGWLGTVMTLGQALLAIGVWSLRGAIGYSRLGRAGLVFTCFGYAALATVSLLALNAGAPDDLTVALTPFYLLAILFAVLGFALLALYAYRTADPGPGFRTIAPLFVIAAVLTLLRPFLAGWVPLHAGAGLAGAVALAWIAATMLRAAR